MATSARARSGWKIFLRTLISCFLVLSAVPVAHLGDGGDAKAGGANYRFKRNENCMMRKINSIRARHGLKALEADKQLAYVARRHAIEMSNTGTMYHDPNVNWKVTHWRRLGQNTGKGTSCRSLTRSFLNSPSHRAQILGRFRFIGIGTQKRGGHLYVQELFESRRNPGNVYHYP